MSEGRDPRQDSLQDIRRDLLTWIRQSRAQGEESFLGGPPLPAPAESASPTSAPPVPAKPSRPLDAPAPAPAARAQAEPSTAAEDDFQESCNDFVAGTLELIRRHGTVQPAGPTGEDKAEALAAIQTEVAACTACSLHGSRTNTVFGAGNPDAGVVFIGEAPGQDEDRRGLPFVGRSGQLLTKIIEAIGFAREDVFICNILKCRPPGNRDPQPAEVGLCEPFLQRQLAVLQPRLICCLGRVAAQTLLQTGAPLGRLRQTVHFYQGIPVMATYHPAALLRNAHLKRDTWDDVRKLRALHDAIGRDAEAALDPIEGD